MHSYFWWVQFIFFSSLGRHCTVPLLLIIGQNLKNVKYNDIFITFFLPWSSSSCILNGHPSLLQIRSISLIVSLDSNTGAARLRLAPLLFRLNFPIHQTTQTIRANMMMQRHTWGWWHTRAGWRRRTRCSCTSTHPEQRHSSPGTSDLHMRMFTVL